MGFDNECILNIQSLAGEYFCPVCRLLVYPNEALQSQCTHLYCKPCLTYVVSTTRACPYDGYLVTEADSKPLIESNKTLADTIGKIAVHCLYHRSGCTWQGQLSECITHCTGCAFGNSPVVCNRCGTQIVHRQVQEHAQNCPGVQPGAQQTEGSQDAATATTAAAGQNQATTQAGASAAQTQVAQISAAPAAVQDPSQVSSVSQPQAAFQPVPTPEQWYQQQQQQQQLQYQQYYQQYPGYDPYQQQYQQYQQQAYQQYPQQQPSQAIPVQQPQIYMQPQSQAQLSVRPQTQPQSQIQPQPQPQPQTQPQSQPQPQPQPQPQTQSQTQSQPQAQSQPQPQPPNNSHPQAQVGVQSQVQPQVNAPNQLQPSHPYPQTQPQNYQQSQLYAQAQPHQLPHPPQMQVQPNLQPHPQVPQHQQVPPQPHQQVPPQPHQQGYPYPQPQSLLPQPQIHPQSHVQLHTHAQMQPQPQLQAQPLTQPQHPSSHLVIAPQSYPQPQPNQQMQPGTSQLPSVHMHTQQQGAQRQLPPNTVQMQAQFPQQQLGQTRPPHSQAPVQQQQQTAMLPHQGQHTNVSTAQQYVHPGTRPPHQQNVQQPPHIALHPQSYPGQTPSLVENNSQQPQLRPQVPPSALPPASQVQQQLQQNVSVSHGLQSYQSQNYTGRPVMTNHGVPHQPSQVGSSGLQSYQQRPIIRPQSSAPQQPGYVHQPVPQQLRNGTVPLPTSAAPPTGTKSQVSSVHPTTKLEIQAEAASQTPDVKETHVLPTPSSQGGARSREESQNDLKPDSENNSLDGDKKSVNESEGKSSRPNLDVKEISGSSKALENDQNSSSQEGLDEAVVKNMVKEDGNTKSESSTGGMIAESTVQNQGGIPRIDKNQDDKSHLVDKEVQDDAQKSLASRQTNMLNGKDLGMPNDGVGSQGKATPQGNILGNERNPLLQPQTLRQGPSQMHDGFGQPGHLGLVSDNQQMPMNYGPPSHMQDRGHQRPPVTDQMSIQNLHPHHMQVPGPPPTHLRPQGHNMLGNVPLQGHFSSSPAHFQQPSGKQPLSSYHPEISPHGNIGPGSSASFGRGPGPFGPQGHLGIGPLPPHNAGGPRIQGDPRERPGFGGSGFGGPRPGAFDSRGIIMGGAPLHGQRMPNNPMDSEFVTNKRSGYYDGRQPDSKLPGSADHVPFGKPPILQSDILKMNGGSARGVSGGFSDPSYPLGLQEERYKHFPEERYRQLPEKGFNLPGEKHIGGFSVESGRHINNRREFFDDLKHFPAPAHLDPEHASKSDGYLSSSRPLDRAPHGFINDARHKLDGASRLLPPFQAGGLRPIDLHDDSGRKVDHVGVHPDFLRPSSESGRLRIDGMPPLRSPGREYSDVPPSRFGRIEDSNGRELRVFGDRPFSLHSDNNPFLDRKFPVLPSHLRKDEFDVPGNLKIGNRVHLRGGDLVGPDILRTGGPAGPRNLHMGEPASLGSYPNPLKLGDVGGPGNFSLNLRVGESIGASLPSHSRPGFGSGMPIHGHASDPGFNAGEVESLDPLRKRKHGSSGWCRICKVDCETVEGLEMHSQTREHQKMAMDMVLNIKKDNAKKQKISSDDHITLEGDSNKAGKTIVENHGS